LNAFGFSISEADHKVAVVFLAFIVSSFGGAVFFCNDVALFFIIALGTLVLDACIIHSLFRLVDLFEIDLQKVLDGCNDVALDRTDEPEMFLVGSLDGIAEGDHRERIGGGLAALGLCDLQFACSFHQGIAFFARVAAHGQGQGLGGLEGLDEIL